MNNKLERHPLGAANRPLTESERDDLRAQILAAGGITNPIELYEGKVLDGWNRYEITLELGLPCPSRLFQGTFEQARAHVLGLEAGRALTLEERLLFRARLDAVPVGGSVPGTDPPAPKSAAEVAREEGVSERQVTRARAVVAKGDEALQRAVEAGKVSMKRGAAIAQLPKQEQPAAIEAPPQRAPRRGQTLPPAETASAEPAVTSPARRRKPDVPMPVTGPTQEAYDELLERNAILVAECERLELRAAMNFMEGTEEERVAAKIMIEELQARVRTLEVELDATKASRNSYMTERNELMRQCTMYRNQLKKAPQDR